MELKIGTALQGSKYVIREVLSQSNDEVLYQATHSYLDQPVLLRSLNPACRQRDDFQQMKQQFVAEVRSQSRQGTSSVLDCFEEDELPFVVLPFKAEQGLELSREQRDIEQPAISQPATLQSAAAEVSSSGKSSPVKDASHSEYSDLVAAFDAALEAESERLPIAGSSPAIADSSANQHSSEQLASLLPTSKGKGGSKNGNKGRTYEPIVFHPMPSSEPIAASNGHGQSSDTSSGRSAFNRFKKLPLPLLAISLIGGCIGVGTGLALRFDAVQSQAGNKPRLSLFNREQSFPSEGNWPIQEWSTPEPTIEQPLYRATPVPEYPSTTLQPLPGETVPLSEPYLEELQPSPEALELPQDTVPPLKSQPKLPADPTPLPELGQTDTIPPSTDRLPPISPDNLLPPTTVTPAPIPPPEDNSPIVEPPPLKSLPDASGI